MDVESYLRAIITKHSVSSDLKKLLTIGAAQTAVSKTIANWAGNQLYEIKPAGSMAKGTAISGSADLDLFISLKSDTLNSWQELYDSLSRHLKSLGYQTRLQNVSMRINHLGTDVDLVIGKKFAAQAGSVAGLFGNHDHSIRTRKNNSWTKTNIEAQIKTVRGMTANTYGPDEFIIQTREIVRTTPEGYGVEALRIGADTLEQKQKEKSDLRSLVVDFSLLSFINISLL